jgi:Leu/Phe-tRNA-protein transferase
MALGLVACGNNSIGFGNYTYRHIHFSDAVEGHCATVDTWYDNTTGIEVRTVEYGSAFFSEGTYSLYEDGSKCPFCNSTEN